MAERRLRGTGGAPPRQPRPSPSAQCLFQRRSARIVTGRPGRWSGPRPGATRCADRATGALSRARDLTGVYRDVLVHKQSSPTAQGQRVCRHHSGPACQRISRPWRRRDRSSAPTGETTACKLRPPQLHGAHDDAGTSTPSMPDDGMPEVIRRRVWAGRALAARRSRNALSADLPARSGMECKAR